jgi:hypothetical protein
MHIPYMASRNLPAWNLPPAIFLTRNAPGQEARAFARWKIPAKSAYASKSQLS